MPERWYVCKVLPPGNNPGVNDFFRPKIFDYNVPHVSVIAQDPNSPTGEPAKNPDGSFRKCLVLVNTLQHAALIADPDIDPFPNVDLDIRLNAIQSVTRLALFNRLKNNHGFDIDFVNSADGMRDLLQGLGQQLDTNFNVSRFEVRG